MEHAEKFELLDRQDKSRKPVLLRFFTVKEENWRQEHRLEKTDDYVVKGLSILSVQHDVTYSKYEGV